MSRAPQPWSQSLRDEWITPLLDQLLTRYPPGHPYHQTSVILRYYPLAMLLLVVGVLAVSATVGLLRGLSH